MLGLTFGQHNQYSSPVNRFSKLHYFGRLHYYVDDTVVERLVDSYLYRDCEEQHVRETVHA